MKTALQELIERLESLGFIGISLDNELYQETIKNAIAKEKQQIMTAVDEGIKYGNSELQTFDYPASRYYNVTFNNK